MKKKTKKETGTISELQLQQLNAFTVRIQIFNRKAISVSMI